MNERSETEIWQDVMRARLLMNRLQPQPSASDRAGRCPDEVAHEEAVGPLDRADWPTPGDEVLYRNPRTGRWIPATVLDVAEHDGDLLLDTGDGPELAAMDAKHGTGRGCWLLYREATLQS